MKVAINSHIILPIVNKDKEKMTDIFFDYFEDI